MERSGDHGLSVAGPVWGSDGSGPGLQSDELTTARRFSRMAAGLYDADGVDGTVEEILRFALHAVNCTAAGVVLVNRRCTAEVAAVTDPAIEQIFKQQFEEGRGPLVTAVRTGHPVTVPDVAADAIWPADWRGEVAAAGFRSVVHLPLRGHQDTIAVLSLYGRHPGQFSDDDRAVAEILARHAAGALSAARTEDSLQYAVDTRDLIGQAKGILMERFDLDADRAFAVLRRYSQGTNTKLRDVADQLVNTRRLPIQPFDSERPAPG